MGVIHWIHCWNHKEELYVGKFWYGLHEGKAPPNLVQEIRQALEKFNPERGPNAQKRDERILALVRAFLERHNGCELRICNDLAEKCEHLVEWQPEGLWTFDIWDDILMNEYNGLAAVERNRKYVARYQTQVSKIQGKLKKPRIIPLRHWWLRRKLSECEENLSYFAEELRKSEEHATRDKSKEAQRQRLIERQEKGIEDTRADLKRLEEEMKEPGIKRTDLRWIEKEYEMQKDTLRGLEGFAERFTLWDYTDLLEDLRTKPLGSESSQERVRSL